VVLYNTNLYMQLHAVTMCTHVYVIMFYGGSGGGGGDVFNKFFISFTITHNPSEFGSGFDYLLFHLSAFGT
jgi:hypothetical protein